VTRYREIICLEEENSESRLSFFDKNILKYSYFIRPLLFKPKINLNQTDL
jgi:hypothetical protein